MANPNISRVRTWLGNTGLRQTNYPLYQVIEALINEVLFNANEINRIPAGGGTGGNGITSLSGDVVASGPGAAVATIQPNVVTYGKIQKVTGLRLVGNPNVLTQDITEIELGDNLEFLNGVLQITLPGGGGQPGIAHRVLSPTHFDSVPAIAQYGDMIYATEGPDLSGEYYHGLIMAPLVEDFIGIRAAYMTGYEGDLTIPVSMGYCPPSLDFIEPPLPDTLLAQEYIDAVILALLVEDFVGIRAGYITDPGVIGIYGAYQPPELDFVAPPNPANEEIPGLWRRLPIGAETDVLTVDGGIPVWKPQQVIDLSWQDIPFDAGDFTAFGGTSPDWTVDSGDVIRWQVQAFPGNNIRLACYLEATTVSGSGPTELRITIPFTINGDFAQFISIQENGAAVVDTYISYDSGVDPNLLFIRKIGGGAFDTTSNATFIAFEISVVIV